MTLSGDSAAGYRCSGIAGATDQFISSLPAMFAGKVPFLKKPSFGDRMARLEILAQTIQLVEKKNAESDGTFLLQVAVLPTFDQFYLFTKYYTCRNIPIHSF